MGFCSNCFEKQQKIDKLIQEVAHLKSKLKYQRKKEKEGYFGSSTPSSKKPIKENTKNDNHNKNGGAKEGHKGYGRKKISSDQADKIEYIYNENEICPECQTSLEKKGFQERTIIDTEDTKPKKILYKCEKKRCPCCKKIYSAKPGNAFDKVLYGNNLIAQICVMHYLHGIPIGRIEAMLGNKISNGSLFSIFHRIAKILKKSEEYLIND